jgi:predicted enzyme related to lactoylglutathione lyase
MISRFCRYDLRTTDPVAARRFYGDVVGLDLRDGLPSGAPSSGEPSMLAVWPLHEQARARGAPAHWLGQIGVTDIEGTVNRLLERGSERLGPTMRTHDGALYAVLRDPLGAVFAARSMAQTALGATPVASPRSPVAWHHLATRDLDRAWEIYTEIFGWVATGTFDVPDPVGGYRMFGWGDDATTAGSMSNTARSPGVHVHWLYGFSVTDLDAVLGKVRASGGVVPAPATTLPNGDRVVACDDPQGAAFGLYQSA